MRAHAPVHVFVTEIHFCNRNMKANYETRKHEVVTDKNLERYSFDVFMLKLMLNSSLPSCLFDLYAFWTGFFKAL